MYHNIIFSTYRCNSCWDGTNCETGKLMINGHTHGMCNYCTVTDIFSSLPCKHSPWISVFFTISAKSTEGKVISSNTLGLFHCMHTSPKHTLDSLQTFSGFYICIWGGTLTGSYVVLVCVISQACNIHDDCIVP